MYRVLLLDEDNSTRFGLRRFPWCHYGFEVTGEAASAQEALAMLAANTYDLLVTDVRLPDMDGLDFLAEVHAKQHHPCTVLLSRYNDFEQVQQAIGLGVFDYLTKPFSSNAFGTLLQRVGIYLSRWLPEQKEEQMLYKAEEQVMAHILSSSEEEAIINLLLSGDAGFARALLEWDRAMAGLTVEKREGMLGKLLNKAEEELNRAYPWLCALVEDQAAPGAFLQRAAQLTELVQRFELAQEKSLLRQMCRNVYQQLEDDVSLHGVATELNISSDYAGRLFKRKTGMSFVTFVTKLKMERGKQLLEEGKCRNYEISTRLGYSNPDYFRQLFKTYTGMTPTEYRTLYHGKVFSV